APSGLALGGGYEVLLHCDALIAHANSVLGLVEAGVGLVPSGGGVKEVYARWFAATGDAEKAAWETWMQVGYGKTGASPEAAAPLRYFREGHDEAVMNRDKLITRATDRINAWEGYTPPAPPLFTLPGKGILTHMSDFMDQGLAKGWFTPHNKTTAMEIATIVVNTKADAPLEQSEQDMLDRERAAFLRLAKTPESRARIAGVLTGIDVDN
ncbi:MAG: 3-hydroxyacyl-CoA dehydrogenase, partial [Pseudomonadota bacterium]